MIRLLKLFLALGALVAFIWFGANISLGSRTLFEHLQAIGKTPETRDLWEGAKGSAEPLIDGVKRRIAGHSDENAVVAKGDGGVATTPPKEAVSAADRKRLRQTLGAEHARR